MLVDIPVDIGPIPQFRFEEIVLLLTAQVMPGSPSEMSSSQLELHDFTKLENTEVKSTSSVISGPLQNVPPSLSQPYLTSWRLAIVIASLGLSTCLVALDTSIIGVAVPKISTVFSSLDDIAWYGSAYLLTVTAFQPTFGNLYKFFNVKAVFLASIVIFEGNKDEIP